MDELTFAYFTEADFSLYQEWFQEAETQHWIEAPSEVWLAYVTTHPDVFAWMICADSTPVGFVQAGFNEDDPKRASFMVVIAPEHRRHGYGLRIIKAVLQRSELASAVVFDAGVHKDNAASRGLIEKAGFRLASPLPDEDGFLNYHYSR